MLIECSLALSTTCEWTASLWLETKYQTDKVVSHSFLRNALNLPTNSGTTLMTMARRTKAVVAKVMAALHRSEVCLTFPNLIFCFHMLSFTNGTQMFFSRRRSYVIPRWLFVTRPFCIQLLLYLYLPSYFSPAVYDSILLSRLLLLEQRRYQHP